MILDGYCDVCGSPAGAVPFVPTATVGAAAPSAADDSSGFEEAAQGKPNAAAQVYRTRVEQAQLPDDVRVAALREVDRLERTIAQTAECREIRIWLDTILELPWGTKATDWTDDIQGSREIEATLQGLIKPAAAEVEKPDTQVEPAEGEADTEEGDTAEVEPAEAEVEEPDTAKPDTAEVEPAVAEADTEEDDTAEVEPAAAEVEEPAAAEVEEPDAAEIEPAATEVEKPNRAPAGPRDDDTVETPAVLAVPSAGPQPGPQPAPQLREQQVVKPVQVQPPTKKRRRSGPLALAVAALVAVLIGAFFVVTRGGGTAQSVPTATATVSTPTTAPSPKPTGTGLGESPIQLARLPGAGRPLQAVQIQGTYRGGPDTLLRVQREEAGVWVDFPTPTVTDASGKFTTYVELGQPGHYRLRVLNPASGITSATFVLVIKG